MKHTALISVFLAGLATAVAAQKPERLDGGALEEAHGAAQKALRTFGLLVNQENFEELGFTNPREASEATLGDPIEEFMIRLDNLQKYEPDQRGIVISPTRRVTYPVLAGGEQRSSLTVERGEDGWAAVSFGAPNYARHLTQARKSLAGDDQRPSSDFFEVRVPALNVSFVAYQDGNDLILTPVTDDPRFGFERGAAIPLGKILEALAPLAREHNGLPT